MQPGSKKYLTALLAIAIVSAGCFKSKNVVTKVGPSNRGQLKLNGVPYALPRTIVQTTVPFKKKDKAPGEFGKYARCFFSREIAAGRITKKSTTFSIGDASFTSRGEPDPNEHYIAKIKGGYFENKTLFLEFNPDGVITKGDASSTNVAIDVAIKAVRTGISIAASAAGGGGAVGAGKIAGVDATKAQLEEAELEAKTLLCRAILVAEAASNAAQAAIAAVEASGNPAEVNATTARTKALSIEQNVANAQNRLADLLLLTPPGYSTSRDLTAALSMLATLKQNLIDEVVCDAKAVKASVLLAATAASAVPAASTQVAAAREAAPAIDTIVTFIGVRDSTAAPPIAAQNRPGCLHQEVDNLPAAAFDNGYSAARQTFARILALKEKREDIASGGAVFQGLSVEALQKMLDETDKAIKSYENTFFLGTVEEDTWTPAFEYRAGRTIVTTNFNTIQTSPVLIWFSKTGGLCETPETVDQGIKIKQGFKADSCPLPVADAQGIWLSLSRLPSEFPFLYQMATANDRDEQRGERGFYYRIPARAVVKLTVGQLDAANALALNVQSQQGQNWNATLPAPAPGLVLPLGTELGRSTMRVAQMGVIASIPASAAGRTTQYTIDFDEATGALKNFRLASNALLEKSVVEEAGGAATDVLAAKQAREKAKAEANDELAKKKRELEILKTQNQINEEKKKLEAGEPTTTPEP